MRKRLLTDERRDEIKKNLLKFLRVFGLTLLSVAEKEIEKKTGIDIPDLPKP